MKKKILCSLFLFLAFFPFSIYSQKGFTGVNIKTTAKDYYDFCADTTNTIYVTDGVKISAYSKTTGDQVPFKGFLCEEKIRSLDISSDDSIIGAGSDGGFITFWNVPTKKMILNERIFKKAIIKIKISRDKLFAAALSIDSGLVIINLKDKSIVKKINYPGATISDMDFSPSSDMISMSFSTGCVSGYDLKTFRKIFSIDAHKGWARCVRFSSNGGKMITSGDDGKIKSWNMSKISNPQWANSYDVAKNWVTCCEIAPDNISIAGGSMKQSVMLIKEFGLDEFSLKGIPLKIRFTRCEDGVTRLAVSTYRGGVSIISVSKFEEF